MQKSTLGTGNQSTKKWVVQPVWIIEGNGGGFAPTRREIEYSTSSCGECSWKSSQGSKDSGGKGEDIMEGVASGMKQSKVTYFANC